MRPNAQRHDGLVASDASSAQQVTVQRQRISIDDAPVASELIARHELLEKIAASDPARPDIGPDFRSDASPLESQR